MARPIEAANGGAGLGARVARCCAVGFLLVEGLLGMALILALSRMATMQCGPEPPDFHLASLPPLECVAFASQAGALFLGVVFVRRAKHRETTSAALAALAVTALGAVIGAGVVLFTLFLALGC